MYSVGLLHRGLMKPSVTLHQTVLPVRFEGKEQSRSMGVQSVSGSPLSLSVVDGNALSQVGNLPEGQLELEYDKPYVIGRLEGEKVPYLAPHLQVTRQVPGSYRQIPVDGHISRAHFQLIARKNGIELVNGVPTPTGDIRPPLNGTHLLEPENRSMEPGESYLIEPGKKAKIRIGIDTKLLLTASEE